MNAEPKNPGAEFDPYTGRAINFQAMVQQLAGMALAQYGYAIGDENAFGDPATAADAAHSLREIAQVAASFADRLESK